MSHTPLLFLLTTNAVGLSPTFNKGTVPGLGRWYYDWYGSHAVLDFTHQPIQARILEIEYFLTDVMASLELPGHGSFFIVSNR
jgi:hypothetical protein